MTRSARRASAAAWSFLVCGGLAAGAAQRGTLREGQYTSPNGVFVVPLPKASNWAGVEYAITELDTGGDRQYDKVMFSVSDFGAYLVASARHPAAEAVSAMDKDDHRTVLKNLSAATLFGWRTDFGQDPTVSREGYFESTYGEAIVRVYRAEKGSFLTKARGRRPTANDRFDTNIVSVLARQGATVVYVLAQDDSKPDDADALVKTAVAFFQQIKVSARR